MFNTLQLNCLIEGHNEVFIVTAAGDDDVSHLLDKIKEQCLPSSVLMLAVWNCGRSTLINAYLNDGSLSHLKFEPDGIESLQSWKSISEYWSGQLPDEFIHIMVKGVPAEIRHPPQPIEGEIPYLEKQHATSVQNGINTPPPSSGAQLPAFKHEQGVRPVMNGRPMENCELLVHLFHPAFSHFQRTLVDPNINLTADDYSRAYKCMRVSAALYETKARRHDAILTCLSEAVGFSTQPLS